MEHVLGLLAAALGTVVSALLTILMVQVRGTRQDTKALNLKLDAHILEITKVLAFKVDIAMCKTSKLECSGLINEAIKKPLEFQIQEIKNQSLERWRAQAEENRQMWEVLRTHSHTGIPGSHDVIFK